MILSRYYAAFIVCVVFFAQINLRSDHQSTHSTNALILQDIENSSASKKAKADAKAVLASLVSAYNGYSPPLVLPNQTASQIFQASETFASGTAFATAWMEREGGGIFLSIPNDTVAQGQITAPTAQLTTEEIKSVESGISINAIKPPVVTYVVCTAVTFIVSWRDASSPNVAISPSSDRTIKIGESITFTSTATHAEGELKINNFEWKMPGSNQWTKDIAGFNGGSTTHLSGILSAAPVLEFTETTAHTRSVTFKPLLQGRYVFRFAAADSVRGFNYTPEVSVMVENIAPSQTISGVPLEIYVGDPAYAITYTASNPTNMPEYQIGISLYEERVDLSGNVYQPSTLIGDKPLSSGNATFTTTRQPPDRPGVIRYRAYAWNQWMTDMGGLYQCAITVPNRTPTISWKDSPDTFEYGQNVTVSVRAKDADNNLISIRMDLNGSAHRYIETAGGDVVLGSNPAKYPAGNYTFTAKAIDGGNLESTTISHTVTVNKATPNGSFSPPLGIRENTALTTVQLSAQFTNPHDGSGASLSGAITYRITSGGGASYPNGSIVTVGDKLPAGIYTICATLAPSQNYNESSATTQFVIEADPNADNDDDGLSNAIENALGLNPNEEAVSSPDVLQVNIHTPTSENQ